MSRKYCTNQLVECLKLIIYKDKHAIQKLRQYEKKIGIEMYTTPLEFDVPATSRQSGIFFRRLYTPLCDCWFEHEYFDFLQNGRCDRDMFTRVCLNIEQGLCEHTAECLSLSKITARVFLIHAAVATINTKVTKYISRQILKRTSVDLNDLKTEFGSLTAAHIAVVKRSNNTLKYVVGKFAGAGVDRERSDSSLRSLFHIDRLAKRNDVTGEVEISEISFKNVIVNLFKLYGTPSHLDILIILLPTLDIHDIEELINVFLSTRNEGLAVFLLNERHVADFSMNSSILLNALFTHSHEFVRNWMKQEKTMMVVVNRETIHALFLTEALGCKKCLSLIDQKKYESKSSMYDICKSHDVSPYIIACYAGNKFSYSTDVLLDILKNLFYKGSCNLNETNSSAESVLHVLLKSDFCSKETVECLLDLGSDVNATDVNGRTPLHVVIDSVDHSNDVVRCLLEHGADVNLKDVSGNTPFLMILEKAGAEQLLSSFLLNERGTIDVFMKRLKDVLYFNPRLDIHPNIFNSVLQIDLTITPSDRSFALFAILLEMGLINCRTPLYFPPCFGFRNDCLLTTIQRQNLKDSYQVSYQQYTSEPRSLQSVCRVRIRQAFPGFRLHKLLKIVNMPKSTRDYILFENALCYDEENEN